MSAWRRALPRSRNEPVDSSDLTIFGYRIDLWRQPPSLGVKFAPDLVKGAITELSVIDLRSDLLCPRSERVAEAMRAACFDAPSMERGEDRHEAELSERLISELGVEAVLLTPTCTMANQIAIRLHLPTGGALLSAFHAHVVTVEARATALTGVTNHGLAAVGGHVAPAVFAEAVRELETARASLAWLENTHMRSAGTTLPSNWQSGVAEVLRSVGGRVHLDGSRLWNAAARLSTPMSALTAGADTVAVSLNKAVGAPVGSVLAGSKAIIAEAVGWRDALGGNWRPLGPIAAAAVAALEGWRERLETDLAMTERLATVLVARLGSAAVQPAPTNLIFLNRPAGDAWDFVQALAREGVGAIPIGPGAIRLAIHSGVREAQVSQVADAVEAAHSALRLAA